MIGTATITGFDPKGLEPGRVHRLWFEYGRGPEERSLTFPILYARAGAGATLVVLAGIHGDEYEGVAAIYKVFAELDPSRLAGALLAVPVCNSTAAAACTRLSPLDHRNLARTFPGRPDGTPSERLAAVLTDEIIARADLLIDLHTAGAKYSMPTLCGFVAAGGAVGERARRAALAFGAPVVWRHDEVGPGRTLTVALEKRIPAVYAETTGGGWLRQFDVNCYVRGVRNILRHLEILPGEPEPTAEPLYVRGGGDLDHAIAAGRSGWLVNHVATLDRVQAGDLLGVILDLLGTPVEEVRAPCAGRVMMRRETPMVEPGDALYALAPREGIHARDG